MVPWFRTSQHRAARVQGRNLNRRAVVILVATHWHRMGYPTHNQDILRFEVSMNYLSESVVNLYDKCICKHTDVLINELGFKISKFLWCVLGVWLLLQSVPFWDLWETSWSVPCRPWFYPILMSTHGLWFHMSSDTANQTVWQALSTKIHLQQTHQNKNWWALWECM